MFKLKHAFAILLTFFLISAFAENAFKLNFFDNNSKIDYVPEDWQFVAHESNFSLFVSRQFSTDSNIRYIHTLTFFDEPTTYTNFGTVSKIYTYAAIDCNNELISLLNDFYVDENNKIVYSQSNNLGALVAEISTKKTARNELYKVVCLPSI